MREENFIRKALLTILIILFSGYMTSCSSLAPSGGGAHAPEGASPSPNAAEPIDRNNLIPTNALIDPNPATGGTAAAFLIPGQTGSAANPSGQPTELGLPEDTFTLIVRGILSNQDSSRPGITIQSSFQLIIRSGPNNSEVGPWTYSKTITQQSTTALIVKKDLKELCTDNYLQFSGNYLLGRRTGTQDSYEYYSGGPVTFPCPSDYSALPLVITLDMDLKLLFIDGVPIP